MTQKRGQVVGAQQGTQPTERSAKNGRNVRKKRGRGGAFNPNFFVEDVEQPRTCKYCRHEFWCKEQSRQLYCAPKTERKLHMFRRMALIDALHTLLRWRDVTLEQIVVMVDAYHAGMLDALKALGWLWNEAQRKGMWLETRRTA